MTSLITRLEAATGPDRELDLEIAVLIGDDAEVRDHVAPYTASLDAALSLVPEGWVWGCGNCECDDAWAWLERKGYSCGPAADPHTYAATPAIALTIAALKARGVE